MASFFKTYREEDGKRIDGVFAMAYIHNGPYHLTHISAFKDGKIDCWGLVNFDEFKKKVRDGWVVTKLPEGAEVTVTFLSRFIVSDLFQGIGEEDFITELHDEIERLNGRPTTESQFADAWEAFEANPSDENRQRVKETYEAVPKHNRRYLLGDVDLKDGPIRAIIYPDSQPSRTRRRS